MSGWIKVIGIGVGNDMQMTPQAKEALTLASDAIGYFPYIERVASFNHLKLHASDNRVELDRAKLAFELAQNGAKIAVISSGDPGVFAMASALFEAMEMNSNWKDISVEIIPGISAMLAASARIGAPLGHDFCAINLSTHLKSWRVLENRLRMAARGDFAMAFYNPRSKTRAGDFSKVLEILRGELTDNRMMIFARNVTRDDEKIHLTTLHEADETLVDMRTIVILGNSQTRQINGTNWVYSPRTALL